MTDAQRDIMVALNAIREKHDMKLSELVYTVIFVLAGLTTVNLEK